MYSTENVFLLCFIYYTYVNSLNSDTVGDKGIKPTVKYSEYYFLSCTRLVFSCYNFVFIYSNENVFFMFYVLYLLKFIQL